VKGSLSLLFCPPVACVNPARAAGFPEKKAAIASGGFAAWIAPPYVRFLL
jgi:hypothetical protein